MSEVTVLDIPLQNSLTPRVGTYSNEGRQDTTFVYDNDLGEYALSGVNSTSKGYSFYYPNRQLNVNNGINLTFDLKLTNFSGSYLPIISLNRSSSVGNNSYFLIEQDGRDININRNGNRPISIRVEYNTWYHCEMTFIHNTDVSYTEIGFKINDQTRNTSESDIHNIIDVTLLGNISNNTSPGNALIKNVKLTTNINYILFNAGNEQLRAYENLPSGHKSIRLKHNNNLYYLLCSSTGLYPSKLRAKINGTTYPILLKHDEDNT